MWPEIEAELHPRIRRILVGRFTCDPGFATCDEIEEKAQAIVDARDREEEVEPGGAEPWAAAAANALGAVGLEPVIDALERGEVRTLLWADQPQAERRHAAMCENCGHLEMGRRTRARCAVRACALFSDAHEAILRHALGRSIEVRQFTTPSCPSRTGSPPGSASARTLIPRKLWRRKAALYRA